MRGLDERAGSQAAAAHNCGRCQTPMLLIAAKPLALSRDVEEHHYKCTKCGAEAAEIVTFQRRPRRSLRDDRPQATFPR
jgi:bacterioferritin-associated ferredoxin